MGNINRKKHQRQRVRARKQAKNRKLDAIERALAPNAFALPTGADFRMEWDRQAGRMASSQPNIQSVGRSTNEAARRIREMSAQHARALAEDRAQEAEEAHLLGIKPASF